MGERYVAVVGAVNMDVWGRSFAALAPRDSNPGEVRLSPGGVGRNIAHNLRLLGVPVKMLTVLGGDAWGELLRKDCLALGIGLERALVFPEKRSSSYVFLTGPEGEMELAVCDADIAGCLTPEVMEANLDLLCAAALVVFDGNLTEETMEFLLRRCTAPLFVDPVSAVKARKLRSHLRGIHTIKPNALEAEAITGRRDPAEAAEALVRSGVRRAFVSMGNRGLCLCDEAGVRRFPCFHAPLVNATGGGDAMMAALCKCYLDGIGADDAARYALAAGALAAAWPETINPNLCHASILDTLKPAATPPAEFEQEGTDIS